MTAPSRANTARVAWNTVVILAPACQPNAILVYFVEGFHMVMGRLEAGGEDDDGNEEYFSVCDVSVPVLNASTTLVPKLSQKGISVVL